MGSEEQFERALRSPQMVGAEDRDGWVALFDPEGVVEDPVEAGRYVGHAEIGRFWDAFIGPQTSVRFEVERDFVGGARLVREATVVTVTEADPQDELRVPALLEYTMRAGRIGSLRAIWDPRRVIGWFVGRGAAGLRALTRHGVRMTGGVGLRRALQFSARLVPVLAVDRARTLVDSLRAAEPRQWGERLARARITLAHADVSQGFDDDPEGALAWLRDRVDALTHMGIDRLVTCGHHVGACLVDEDGGGALALLLRADAHGRVDTMTAIWSPDARVLALPEPRRSVLSSTSERAGDRGFDDRRHPGG